MTAHVILGQYSCHISSVALSISTTLQSPEHEERFRAGRKSFQYGQPTAPICGARSRSGTPCQQPPIKEGKGRCLAHAGPKAANDYHLRKRREFESGKITAAEWNRLNARRAANHLGDEWKKDPWLPGSTIDLGEHEVTFRAALNGRDPDDMPPAVADWLRWRYRRTQIDRLSEGAWRKTLMEDLPRRLDAAGPRPPLEAALGSGKFRQASPKTWVVEAPEAGSRRAIPDTPKAPKLVRGKGYARPGRPRTQDTSGDEYADLMEVYRAHMDVARPIMDAMNRQGDKLAVLRALRDYVRDPTDMNAMRRWVNIGIEARRRLGGVARLS